MKKIIPLLTVMVLLGCKVTKQNLPKNVVGINKNYKLKKFQKDSLNFVTPNIELYNTKGSKSKPDFTKREILKQNIIYSLRKELKKAKYLTLELMSKDYSTITNITEGVLHNKFAKPNWIIKAPKELISNSKKNTVLISITGHHGKQNTFHFNLSIIDNKNKRIEYSKSYRFIFSPLNYKKVEEIIKMAIAEITL